MQDLVGIFFLKLSDVCRCGNLMLSSLENQESVATD